MELSWSLFIWSTICFSVVTLLLPFRRKARISAGKLPPGPRGLPIVGNLFDLGSIPHQTLAGLTQKHGPVIWLQLGAVNNVVILSTKAAKEMFKNHDVIYSGRTITDAMRACSYDEGSLAIAQYGPYWRTMKRIVITELSTNKQMNESAHLRRKWVDKMIQWVSEEADDQGGVHLAQFVFLMTFNLLGNLMLSRDLIDPKSKEGPEFFNAMDGLMEGGGLPNIADFFPFLKWLDPQRIRKRMNRDIGQAMHIVSRFVKERIQEQKSGEHKERRDFLDALLAYEGVGEDDPAELSERDLIILILEIFLAGTETTSSTTEWAMTELLRHPEIMTKVQKELLDIVGDRKMEESDVEKLHYLRAVVKETLRLHPPIPFLVPRRAVEDNEFMGYHIPKDTQVLVNAWAIGRDPDSWDDPLSFKPERFLDSLTDFRGQHFEFIPFGAGRRKCAGILLADQVLHLGLGSLLHTFDWKLDHSLSPHTIDMNERLGITLRKEVPLKVLPNKRCIQSIQSNLMLG